MENNETIVATAIGLSILALLGCVCVGGYVYFNQPQEVEPLDISGINVNTLLVEGAQRDIVSLGGDIYDLGQDIEDLDFDINEDDLDDLESDLKKYCRNKIEDECDDCEVGPIGPQGIPGINGTDGSDGVDGIDGVDGTDGEDSFLNEDEYNCLVNATNYTEFRTCIDAL